MTPFLVALSAYITPKSLMDDKTHIFHMGMINRVVILNASLPESLMPFAFIISSKLSDINFEKYEAVV